MNKCCRFFDFFEKTVVKSKEIWYNIKCITPDGWQTRSAVRVSFAKEPKINMVLLGGNAIMSNDYPKKAEVSGNVRISENVICSIAKIAALDVDGVKATADQHISFFRKQAAVSVEVINDMVEITMRLILRNGFRLTSVAEQVQKTVKENVQSMTGVIVSKVHVIAADIAFEE